MYAEITIYVVLHTTHVGVSILTVHVEELNLCDIKCNANNISRIIS